VNYNGTPDHEDTFIDLDGFAIRPRDVDRLSRTPDGNTTVVLLNGGERNVRLPYDTVRVRLNLAQALGLGEWQPTAEVDADEFGTACWRITWPNGDVADYAHMTEGRIQSMIHNNLHEVTVLRAILAAMGRGEGAE
jgi:hypothetical protein